MKKIVIYKTVQLVVLVLLGGVCVSYLVFFPDLFPWNRDDVAFVMLWLLFVLCMIGLLLDFCFFSSFMNYYKKLSYALTSDLVSGIPNRLGCDAIIDKYASQPVPGNFACIMFELANIRDINLRLGHTEGNQLIRDFSNILHDASTDLCFVGRNGGNRFLALFEDASEGAVDKFLDRVLDRVRTHNEDCFRYAIEYRYGIALHESAEACNVTELIALADSRINLDTEGTNDNREI